MGNKSYHLVKALILPVQKMNIFIVSRLWTGRMLVNYLVILVPARTDSCGVL